MPQFNDAPLGAIASNEVRLLGRAAPVFWVCLAELRWNGSVLEQRWGEQFSDNYEWRPVPKIDGTT